MTSSCLAGKPITAEVDRCHRLLPIRRWRLHLALLLALTSTVLLAAWHGTNILQSAVLPTTIEAAGHVAPAEPPSAQPPQAASEAPVTVATLTPAPPTALPPTATPVPETPAAIPTPVNVQPTAPPVEVSTVSAAPISVRPQRVTAIGDSVMLGAKASLEASIPGISVDAAVGRQVDTALSILRDLREVGALGDVAIIHIGNNGDFTPAQFDEMMRLLDGVPVVIVLNLSVPRAWEEPNNAVIADGMARSPRAVLIDWHTASLQVPGNLASDGVHLTPQGAQAYAQLVIESLQSR